MSVPERPMVRSDAVPDAGTAKDQDEKSSRNMGLLDTSENPAGTTELEEDRAMRVPVERCGEQRQDEAAAGDSRQMDDDDHHADVPLSQQCIQDVQRDVIETFLV